ncbi:glycosyltransferase family 1 protein [Mucilaginibacter sp. L196]|uniref:glycosyltransferase family 4 protein n=1 Tax=Mucilaginibacter sp. L196 TaxID=1641870 RepID=UPI00131DB25D|nr:glycosyltransferase family 1 protein [Mucilaginibacter sp. L196]
MKIVLFAHPDFLGQQSMPRFTNMLAESMRVKGYTVEIYSPQKVFSKIAAPSIFKKWFGYVDQFIIFPLFVRKQVKRNNNTFYLFTDHALGMWVPIVKRLPNLIICHDFLAQRSAKGEIPQNPTGLTGKIYQRLIRKGYSKGENFIAVSKRTQEDLHRFLGRVPKMSKVVYNGLNKDFDLIESFSSRDILSKLTGIDLKDGYILHVGGNQWYKNRMGVVKIYTVWRLLSDKILPLLLIGIAPSEALKQEIETSPYKNDIFTLDNINDEYINVAYSGASVLLFPSIAEGFGWPIAEAMASGCPVITTNEAPMTEVGGDAAIYIDIMPLIKEEIDIWAEKAANTLNQLINSPETNRVEIIRNGKNNAKRFDTNIAMDEIERYIRETQTLINFNI